MNVRNKEVIEKIRNMKPPEDCIGLSELAKSGKKVAKANIIIKEAKKNTVKRKKVINNE